MFPMEPVGSLVAGKYRITRQLGSGGMGSVFKAENVSIGRVVAVKLLHPHLADDEVSLARFQREAKAAASVSHRHLVEILDLGVESSGVPYIVMEYVRGRSLADALRFDRNFEPARACYIAGQILSALSAVHAQGIVHRDLKPENVLLTSRDGRADFVKVLDFGVAAFSEDVAQVRERRDLTPSGRVMGSPHYTSPEQILGRVGADPRVDVWSVGVMLYQMLAGSRPFSGTKLDELCDAIVKKATPTLGSFGVTVPDGLEDVVRRALRKDPESRFQDAGSMRRALIPFGAEDVADEDPEPTDTFTIDLRTLRERELLAQREKRLEPSRTGADGLSGRFTLIAREVVRERYPVEAINQAVGGARAEVHARFVGTMSPEDWYSDAWFDFLERIDIRHGKGDRRLLADVGRELVRRGDASMFRAPTPELAFANLPTIWAALFRVGKPSIDANSRGHGRMRVEDVVSPRLARSIAFVGVIEECLHVSGGLRVDVRLTKSIVLGDPHDRYEASWSHA